MQCFSFKCYLPIQQYDQKVLSLLRRMSHLEKLTLYLRVKNRDAFIDSSHLENEIFLYMPQLRSYTFYISTYITIDSFHYIPSQDSQRIITNIRQQSMTSIINYIDTNEAVCHIFSLPFIFDRIEDLGNIFPDSVFNYVTYLLVEDIYPFNHEVFIRVARSFPLLNHFRIVNLEQQSSRYISSVSSNNTPSNAIAEYHHLTLLNLRCVNTDYIEQFLNEAKTYVPCLTELTVSYNDLRIVTNNFTKEETRRNCAKVKRLTMIGSFVHLKEFYLYFPLL